MPLLGTLGAGSARGFGWGGAVGGGPIEGFFAIASTTLASNSSSVTFSGIPADYRDLLLVCSSRLTTVQVRNFRFNSDGGSNYSYQLLQASPTSGVGASTSASNSSIQLSAFFETNSLFTGTNIIVPNYANTTFKKNLLCKNFSDNNNTNTGETTGMLTGFWNSTSAVTSVTLLTSSQFAAGSVFALYGLGAA